MADIEIYALCDPDTQRIRYIGKAKNAAKRLKSHLAEKRRTHYPVYRWIAKLRSEGRMPVLRILETCNESDWKQREIALIASHPNLLNVAEGGDEPFCSKETRAQNGRNLARAIQADPFRKRVQELKLAISRSLRSGHCSETAKEKLRY